MSAGRRHDGPFARSPSRDSVDRAIYTRRQLLGLRCAPGSKSTVFINDLAGLSLLRYRGKRAGVLTRSRQARASVYQHDPDPPSGSIQIVRGYRPSLSRRQVRRPSVLVDVGRAGAVQSAARVSRDCNLSALPMYVLNAAGLSKQHAVEHLAADLNSHGVDVAVITETHFSAKHSDSIVSVPGYTLHRRDRCSRNASGRLMRGGGVAVYIRSTLQSAVWKYSCDEPMYELLWVRSGDMFIGALYNPPKPQYHPQSLVAYVDGCVQELTHDFPNAEVVIAGDFNKLPDTSVVAATGFSPIVHQPTRGANLLDQIYVSDPLMYDAVRVIKSVVKSDHQAVVAYSERGRVTTNNQTTRASYRRITPGQHAAFLQHVKDVDFTSPPADSVQAAFDNFYSVALGLLNWFYPERMITVRSRDPAYITPRIKSLLRKRNRLMRAGRIEKAGAIARRVGKEITKHNRTRLQKYNGQVDAKDMWAAVRQLTGRQQQSAIPDNIDADRLNRHYANISTDRAYVQPPVKLTVMEDWTSDWVTEQRMFRLLDSLKPTATGLDGLPAWFLRLGAPVFCRTLADLINLSFNTSTVPTQWKLARICPVPKKTSPTQASDFRPISVTAVLSRITEKIIVRDFLYPALDCPPPALCFTDQYAFRPSGSTTAALVALLHSVTHALETSPYVVVVALDFSKAFDTVRHSSVMAKVAQLNIPDFVYNWLANFLDGHSHCTRFSSQTSDVLGVNAGIVQGSAVGPAMYVVCAADLQAVTLGNSLMKYADDTYLVIPACNVDSRDKEIANVEAWSQANNLTLNRGKSAEIVFRDNRKRCCDPPPALLQGVERVTSLKALGVTFSDRLSVTAHVDDVTSASARSMYAISVLRSHGMNASALQRVFHAVVVSRLIYAAPAWRGFATSADRHRIDAVLRRASRTGLWTPAANSDIPTFETLCSSADDELFSKTVKFSNHILHALLPPPSTASQSYRLRHRTHSLQLPGHSTHLADCDFLIRMLYKNCY
jgi:hypothetical protein